MSTLHTVNKSPFEKSSLASCLAHVAADAGILLYEDGIYAGLKSSSVEAQVSGTGAKVYVLGEDLKARGVAEDKLIDGIEVVDYAGFVDLVEKHDKVLAWV